VTVALIRRKYVGNRSSRNWSLAGQCVAQKWPTHTHKHARAHTHTHTWRRDRGRGLRVAAAAGPRAGVPRNRVPLGTVPTRGRPGPGGPARCSGQVCARSGPTPGYLSRRPRHRHIIWAFYIAGHRKGGKKSAAAGSQSPARGARGGGGGRRWPWPWP
jgi:hypothetical protein